MSRPDRAKNAQTHVKHSKIEQTKPTKYRPRYTHRGRACASTRQAQQKKEKKKVICYAHMGGGHAQSNIKHTKKQTTKKIKIASLLHRKRDEHAQAKRQAQPKTNKTIISASWLRPPGTRTRQVKRIKKTTQMKLASRFDFPL